MNIKTEIANRKAKIEENVVKQKANKNNIESWKEELLNTEEDSDQFKKIKVTIAKHYNENNKLIDENIFLRQEISNLENEMSEFEKLEEERRQKSLKEKEDDKSQVFKKNTKKPLVINKSKFRKTFDLNLVTKNNDKVNVKFALEDEAFDVDKYAKEFITAANNGLDEIRKFAKTELSQTKVFAYNPSNDTVIDGLPGFDSSRTDVDGHSTIAAVFAGLYVNQLYAKFATYHLAGKMIGDLVDGERLLKYISKTTSGKLSRAEYAKKVMATFTEKSQIVGYKNYAEMYQTSRENQIFGWLNTYGWQKAIELMTQGIKQNIDRDLLYGNGEEELLGIFAPERLKQAADTKNPYAVPTVVEIGSFEEFSRFNEYTDDDISVSGSANAIISKYDFDKSFIINTTNIIGSSSNIVYTANYNTAGNLVIADLTDVMKTRKMWEGVRITTEGGKKYLTTFNSGMSVISFGDSFKFDAVGGQDMFMNIQDDVSLLATNETRRVVETYVSTHIQDEQGVYAFVCTFAPTIAKREIVAGGNATVELFDYKHNKVAAGIEVIATNLESLAVSPLTTSATGTITLPVVDGVYKLVDKKSGRIISTEI